MKFISSFICLLSFVNFALAQKQTENILPVDERGKLIYLEVVSTKAPVDSLKIRVLNYLKKQNENLKFKSVKGDSIFIATGKLIINKTLLVMSHPSGEVLYNFQAEVKQGKYRFWLTDFSFIPYQRDRYGNFVTSTTVGVPLENNPSKLNAAEWEVYRLQTAKYANELAAKFKLYMTGKPLVIVQVTKIQLIGKEW